MLGVGGRNRELEEADGALPGSWPYIEDLHIEADVRDPQ